jgi:hypothetical protein
MFVRAKTLHSYCSCRYVRYFTEVLLLARSSCRFSPYLEHPNGLHAYVLRNAHLPRAEKSPKGVLVGHRNLSSPRRMYGRIRHREERVYSPPDPHAPEEVTRPFHVRDLR